MIDWGYTSPPYRADYNVTFPPLGWTVMPSKHLEPRWERERSCDGSCVNLSAVERNAKAMAEASKVYIHDATRTIVCAPFMKARIVAEIGKAQLRG